MRLRLFTKELEGTSTAVFAGEITENSVSVSDNGNMYTTIELQGENDAGETLKERILFFDNENDRTPKSEMCERFEVGDKVVIQASISYSEEYGSESYFGYQVKKLGGKALSSLWVRKPTEADAEVEKKEYFKIYFGRPKFFKGVSSKNNKAFCIGPKLEEPKNDKGHKKANIPFLGLEWDKEAEENKFVETYMTLFDTKDATPATDLVTALKESDVHENFNDSIVAFIVEKEPYISDKVKLKMYETKSTVPERQSLTAMAGMILDSFPVEPKTAEA